MQCGTSVAWCAREHLVWVRQGPCSGMALQGELQGARAEAVGVVSQVNSFGSLAQAVVVFLLLPGLAALRGISPGQLPQYLQEGADCCLCSSTQAISCMPFSESSALHVYLLKMQGLGAGRAATRHERHDAYVSISSSGSGSVSVTKAFA